MRSLRSRLTFTHALVAFVGVVIVAVLVTAVLRLAFDRLTDRRIQAEADAAADVIAAVYQRRQSWDGVAQVLQRRVAQNRPNDLLRRRRLLVYDASGNLVFDNGGGLAPRQSPPRTGLESPITVDGRAVGSVVMGGQVGEFTQAETEFLRMVRWSLIAGSALAVLIALVVGRVITGRVTRPLRSMQGAAHRLASGGSHQPLAIPPDRELAELAVSFNTMAAELGRQEQLRRQQVADIAHELRTPLSVLRLQLESIEDGIAQPTPETLRSLAEETSLLTRLVDDLRLLSLADAGQLSLAIEAVDASAAGERVVGNVAPRARQQQIDLRIERPQAALAVLADPQRLLQILGNLIENALRYTPAGGTVTLRLAQSAASSAPSLPAHPAGWVVFEVADTGAGIPASELPQIFERFYRADKARARETGGSGLGLAIVQRLVEMQSGRIWVSSALGQGTTFHVALPAARPEASAA
jgi:signal transduction histidine kinase